MSAISALRRKTCAAFVLLFVVPQASAQAPPRPAPASPPTPVVRAEPTLAPPPPVAASQAPKPHGAEKTTPKPGPGANDAGERATSLRTNRLSLVSLIDRSVVGRERHEVGHVIDVLIDAKGQPAALVVDVGGFMGMGNRRIAIAWERFALAGRKPADALQIPFSEAQVKAAPAYDGSQQVTVIQSAIEPAPSKASLATSRVDLGEDLGPLSNAPAPQADSLNPD